MKTLSVLLSLYSHKSFPHLCTFLWTLTYGCESNFGGVWVGKSTQSWQGFESSTVAVVDFGFVPVALEKGLSLALQADLCRNFLWCKSREDGEQSLLLQIQNNPVVSLWNCDPKIRISSSPHWGILSSISTKFIALQSSAFSLSKAVLAEVTHFALKSLSRVCNSHKSSHAISNTPRLFKPHFLKCHTLG